MTTSKKKIGLFDKQWRLVEKDGKDVLISNDGSPVPDKIAAAMSTAKHRDMLKNQNLIIFFNEKNELRFFPDTEWNEISPDKLEHASFIRDMDKVSHKKPHDLMMTELYWKALCRAVMKGKNTLMVGESRSGKTTAAIKVAEAFEKNFYKFDMGSTQDPRAVLIGNTRLDKDGTFFDPAPFVKAIQDPNAVILLDEVTRVSHDGSNILMPVLDVSSRELRLDEQSGDVIKVADGVCFIGTANIGGEYTSTRRMDLAFRRRWSVKIEMAPLEEDQEQKLIQIRYPDVSDEISKTIASIAFETRKLAKEESSVISQGIPTGTSLEIAELIYDGFTLQECFELQVYPEYDDIGGAESERKVIMQLCQRYLKGVTNASLY